MVVPSCSATDRMRPGTARHIGVSFLSWSPWFGLWSKRWSACGADQDLAEGEAPVVGWQQPRPQHREPAVLEPADGRAEQQHVLEHAAAEDDGPEPGPMPLADREQRHQG